MFLVLIKEYSTQIRRPSQLQSAECSKSFTKESNFFAPLKKYAKKFKKGVDKQKVLCYNSTVRKSLVWLNGRAADL